jgi:hypothetical protein
MKELIILGNGTSRLNHLDFITKSNIQIWGCNLAFRENINFNLIGSVHNWVVEEAIKYRKEHNLNFEILYPNIIPEIKKEYNLFQNYLGYSTGNELMNEAILRGYDTLYLLGFDSLNNSKEDIYTKNLVIVNFIHQIDVLKKKYNLKQTKYQDNIFILKK